MIIVKSLQEIELMRQAGRIVAGTLQELAGAVRPGITTIQLDTLARQYIQKSGARPAFLGYHGFPATICTSLNEEVVHGIPGLRRLKAGDIISIDVGVFYKGYYGDAAATFPVGEVSPLAKRLLEVTRESLYKGIEKAYPGNRLYDISAAIQTYVESRGFSVVRSYVGHGIGSEMHEEPQVPNFGLPGKGPLLEAGMVLAIEPMVNAGTWEVETLSDDWTVVTKDRNLSAHFEHTVAIMQDGPEILTSF
ncbi:MAG TPA: type I methionyl aminopeptidase [Firmicutes bacterium]|nr:type I methionyl aminopeptidase [Bacillota bacterium]HAA33765.1 type I methionyl aminopeptidase [Bacillota bacterium]